MRKISDLLDVNDEIILISIREEYFDAIISGIKKYEYRKNYRKVPTKAFIYISKTKKSIVALVEFGKPIFGSVEEICEISESENPGSYDDMTQYLNSGKGVAIPVEKVHEFTPISLIEMKSRVEKFTVPQSYYMLDNKREVLNILKDKEVINTLNIEKC